MTPTSMSSGTADPTQRTGKTPPAPVSLRLDGRALPVVGTARVYTCGITPYDVTHLGHAATFVWADVLTSVLQSTGVDVHACRNITDVDDVLTTAARERGRYYDEFALAQEAVFDQSMRALRVATPAACPRARHHVDAVQQLAQGLLDAGAAYERDRTVWFRGAHVVGQAGLDPERARALSTAFGDEPDSADKDHPFDVAVWRPSTEEHPAWPSPWGWGRPGWHAECAAMALNVQGSSVDVLVGGDDLVFPHHAYQAAMVEALTGVTPFARSLLHVGEVRLDGEKMAKSTGNLVLVDDVLHTCTPAALRTLIVDRDHREPWSFETADLHGAEARLERLYAAAGRGGATPAAVAAATAPLLDGLDVRTALDVAESEGGEAARRVVQLLRLG
ncbi:L-cysteine:1D-myo-inositol 2-amino-2-deoxy-alpha-D-glucopyranoside ligase [Nocardioides dokdonensis FR1436]|uniref:L-cysteine:1D-myo-inositol 2-amino-2-deoxy-alpha-D-glucopyranoside ligase n=1 Tax=Nocardioides dokdonensis FR1436 TaxID=1300347 RepID=A0A1A9GQ64_9ACTN|nr:cysteine--tRNA ligase [Nocardioides dokdonensis]ANH40454.1 L-cysteine:1D-myo-inositol 2-amino-2-deoxy-alpha-D-glucopyranoside ligase [Nocardioides dokdonensis FR1436]